MGASPKMSAPKMLFSSSPMSLLVHSHLQCLQLPIRVPAFLTDSRHERRACWTGQNLLATSDRRLQATCCRRPPAAAANDVTMGKS